MNCTKAIIPMAGYGTRRLPVTKAIDKCMLPIGNRPIVDYVVEDCLKAGITDIIFIINDSYNQIQTFYGHNQKLEDFLVRRGKAHLLDELNGLATKAQFHYVVQDHTKASGTAVTVDLCRNMIESDEEVVVLMGDDFIYHPDGQSEVANLIQTVEDAGLSTGLIGVEIPQSETYRYGVIQYSDDNGKRVFEQIVEKPKPEEAPSNLINISKYLFDSHMFDYVDQVMHQPPTNGEYYITDALNYYQASGKQIAVVPAKGEYLDGGSLEGWLYANNRVCKDILKPQA